MQNLGGQTKITMVFSKDSGLYGIKCCVTALPHVRDACLFFLKVTGFFSF